MTRSPALLVPGLVLVAACSVADDAVRPVVTLTAVDYAFTAPDTVAAGFTTFRFVNQGSQLHLAQLVRLDEGRSLDEFLAAYAEAFRTTGPRPAWAPRFGGPGVAEPGGSANATLHLEPGQYAWICIMDVPDGIPHVVKTGMAKAFTVRARAAGDAAPAAPAASIVVRLLDYSFALSALLTEGRHTIKVENAGAEPHEIGLLRLAAGKTRQDFETWMRNPQGPPPATVVGGVASLAPSLEAYFEADLTRGDYVLLCMVTAPDGRPHTEHGMIQHVRIG